MRALSVKEAAAYIGGVHPDTIYTMVKRKEIPHFRIRRRIMFSKEALDAWAREQESLNYEPEEPEFVPATNYLPM